MRVALKKMNRGGKTKMNKLFLKVISGVFIFVVLTSKMFAVEPLMMCDLENIEVSEHQQGDVDIYVCSLEGKTLGVYSASGLFKDYFYYRPPNVPYPGRKNQIVPPKDVDRGFYDAASYTIPQQCFLYFAGSPQQAIIRPADKIILTYDGGKKIVVGVDVLIKIYSQGTSNSIDWPPSNVREKGAGAVITEGEQQYYYVGMDGNLYLDSQLTQRMLSQGK
jgi:hypothetical protein